MCFLQILIALLIIPIRLPYVGGPRIGCAWQRRSQRSSDGTAMG